MTDTPTVRWHVTMSLDGFIAGPHHEMDWLPASGPMPDLARHVVATTGAILAGRRWHDAVPRLGGLRGIYRGTWQGPVLVLTHRPGDQPVDPAVTFVSGGIDAAVDAALAAAAGKDVVVFGADLARQAIAAGRLDEIVVHVAPALLGEGIRLQVGARTALDPIHLGSTGSLADLHYRIVRTG